MFIKFIPALCLIFIAGCQCQTHMGTTPEITKTIDVSVLYRERIMLPPGSELTVTLSDVSKMDVPAEVISSVSQSISTAPPYQLSLSYDEDKIVDNHRYSLKARIEKDGQLLFISTYAIDPFASDKQPIEIITEKVTPKPAQTPRAALTNTHWRMLVAKGIEREVGEGQKEPYLYLAHDKNRIRGFAGCNNFAGSFEQKENKLTFSQVVATMKMCIKGMEQEQSFLAALNETASFKISVEELYLFDGGNNAIASFQAGYFK